MKLALAQLNFTVGNFIINKEKILNAYERAAREKSDLVIFPELSITGYPPKDLLLKKSFLKQTQDALEEVMSNISSTAAVIGYVEENPSQGKPFYNSIAFIRNGKILKKIRKILIPSYDVFDEDRYFEPGTEAVVIDYGDKKLGISICEDIWNDKDYWKARRYSRDPIEEQIMKGAKVIINCSASPYVLGKQKLRYDMLSSIAKKYKVPAVFCNLVGATDELIFDGCSQVISEKGEIIARGKSFEEDIIYVDLDEKKGTVADEIQDEAESIYKALVLGTRDYITKCGFKKVVIGLSGGIDSSVVACIAVEAISADNVLGISMPSRFSSQASIKDAMELAKNLSIPFIIIDIEKIYESYLSTLKESFAGLPEDVAEQNIQARIRGNILMAFSNKFNRLVLSTGNKSELAVGYCTLYGDMTGGLAVLADVPKTYVYKLAHYINREREIIPVNIIRRAPSAELKANQKDQDDLPPYEILDQVLKLYIEEEKSFEEILDLGFEEELVRSIINKVEKNEFKRRQAPPGLKVTSRSFGIGRRIPIAHSWQFNH